MPRPVVRLLHSKLICMERLHNAINNLFDFTFCSFGVKIEWSTKKNGFAHSFSFSSFLLFFWEKRKGGKITSCSQFSDPIDFHPNRSK